MRNIIKSCLEKSDDAYVDYLKIFKDEATNYQKNYRIPNIISDEEVKVFDFMISCYENSGQFPSNNILVMNFPELNGAFDDAREIPIGDMRVYVFGVLDNRVNNYIHDRMAQLNIIVKEKGITSEISDEFDKLQKISNRNKAKNISIDMNAKDTYNMMKLRPLGLVTGIRAVDERIGGMNPGTVTTIAGFTSQYKTTFALNIARINSYVNMYNIAYISLETPKTDMYWNLLSCHSYEPHLAKVPFVSHDKMRQCAMTPAEEDFVFNEVEPDLYSQFQGPDGNMHDRGRIVFLDESDFDSFSFGEISSVLEKVDDQLGGKLDAVIVDYIQLCKFSGDGMTRDANSQINSYVTFFRRLAQNFRKTLNPDGTESVKQLTMILLSQINRDNWRRARNNEGRYDITCLADANELERGSYRVFTTYTTEEMKGRKAAQVQILKNRTGQTMYDPVPVFADGEAYVFTDEDGMNSTFGGDIGMSVDSALSSIDFDDLGSLGI